VSIEANGVEERETGTRTSNAAEPAEISGPQRYLWSLRRELWESRSLYLAPLAVAALILVGTLIGGLSLAERVSAASAHAPGKRHETMVQPYVFSGLLLMGTTFILSIFYSLDALQSERRDRSILFWKSLPVSDTTTVLAKATIPIVLLPLLTVVIAVVTQILMLLASSVGLLLSGHSAAPLWAEVSLPAMWVALFHHMVAVHGLWYAPIYAWLLFVSAWSQRVPWLWASLPLIAIGVVERIAFGTSAFGNMLANRLGGGIKGDAYMSGSLGVDPLTHVHPGEFLSNPGLWVGLAAAAVLLAAAVRLRRRRGPI
jgi:ABC-2 type transport system permease protein